MVARAVARAAGLRSASFVQTFGATAVVLDGNRWIVLWLEQML